jgi:putative ABC transport system permease protein
MSFRFLRLALVLCGQALRALLRHKGRTTLSAIGIAIAIAAVVWVVALGREGATRAAALLQDLGDNLVWVEAGSRNVAGVRTGAKSTNTLTLGDAEAIAREITGILRVSPQVDGNVQLVSPRSNWSTRSRGVAPAYLTIKRFGIASGAVFTDEDVTSGRNVLVMGQTVRERLYGTENPVGQVLRMNGQPFEVIGLLARRASRRPAPIKTTS